MKRSNQREEEKPQYMKESSILCKHCGKNIISTNYLIHEARCGLMSSRVYREERQEKPEMNEIKREKEDYPSINPNFKKQEIKREIKPIYESKNFNQQRERPRIFQQKKEEEERIPCPFCGYGQTLAQLDTHPQQCEHRQQQCPECHESFPRSLMDEHLYVCESRRRRSSREQPQQPQRGFHNLLQGPLFGEQEQEDYNPYGNFASILEALGGGGRRRQNAYQQRGQSDISLGPRHAERGSGFMVIQRRDNRGNIVRQVIPAGNFQEGFGERGEGRGGAFYSPFSNFFALLEMMAARHAHVEQGLNKEEIKNLKRIKYSGDNSKKAQNQKDLCTICYCQFEKDEKLIELKCKHLYHEECITKWVQKTAKCPVCKAPQTDRDIFQEDDD